MRGLIGVVTGMLLSAGCTFFPTADVRHAHAEVNLVRGVEVVPPDEDTNPHWRPADLSHLAQGKRVVLLVLDEDSEPGWLHSESAQGLLLEFPALRHGGSWVTGEHLHVWYWEAGSKQLFVRREFEGRIVTRRVGRSRWSIDVFIREAGEEVAANEYRGYVGIKLRHRFTVGATSYGAFRKRYPPETGWTK